MSKMLPRYGSCDWCEAHVKADSLTEVEVVKPVYTSSVPYKDETEIVAADICKRCKRLADERSEE